MKKVSDKEIIDIYKKYKAITVVMKETGVSYIKIKRILLEHGLFEQKFNIKRLRKNNVNDEYFKHIDSSDKAYWLGFLWGDGYISELNNLVGVSLSQQDKHHLEKFKDSIEFTGKIHNYKTTGGFVVGLDYCRISFVSSTMINDLKAKGFLAKKSLIMKPPFKKCISEEFKSHFWRGVFDANGSLSLRKNGRFDFHLCGTKEMLNEFIKDLSINTTTKLYQRKLDCPVYDLKLSISKNNIDLLNNLYKNSFDKIRLDRKYAKYIEIKNNV